MSDKLKPCPCCGSTSVALSVTGCSVFCKACGVQTAEHANEERAERVWNTRPAETVILDRVREKIEAARKHANMPYKDWKGYEDGLRDTLRVVDEVEKERSRE